MSFASKLGYETFVVPEGLSEEERQKFLEESGKSFDKTRAEKEKLKLTRTPDIERVKYNYTQRLGVHESKVPDFMKMIFIHPGIDTSQKDLFADQFCRVYLNNEEYRLQNEGKFIFLEDFKMKGIIDSWIDLDPSIVSNKMAIKISK